MAKKSALGRGLGALISDVDSIKEKRVQDFNYEIKIEEIETNPFQPRTQFNEEALLELAQSIDEIGIIQPITVRKIGAGAYQLISGERRLRASVLAGLEKIPAFVRTADDAKMLEMALVENIQRENLDAIEIAVSYQRLLDECSLTQDNLSDRIGKKRSTISNYLRLLKLPAQIQKAIREKQVSMGHARALINIEDKKQQIKILNKTIQEDLSVRKVEELVRELSKPKEEKIKKANLTEEYEALQEHLSNFFKTKINLKRTEKGKGTIVIPFNSDDELERLISVLDK